MHKSIKYPIFVLLIWAMIVPAQAPAQEGQLHIHYGETVTGVLTQTDHADEWLFVGHAGDVIAARMDNTSGTLDPYLALLAPDGQTISEDDDSGTGHNALVSGLSLPADGVYTLLAGRYSGTGSYALTLTRMSAPDLTFIGYGEARLGSRLPGSPPDAYIFVGNAGDVITIEMNIASSGDLNPHLELLGPEGNILAADDDGGLGVNSRLSDFHIPVDGEYTILADGDGAGDYTIWLLGDQIGPPPSLPGLEYHMVEYGDELEGSIDDATPYMLYIFGGAEGDSVYLNLTATSGDLIPMLEVSMGSAGEMLTPVGAVAGNEAQRTVEIMFTAPGTTWYLVLVSRADATIGETSGTFRLSIEGGPGEFGPQPEVDCERLSFGQVVELSQERSCYLFGSKGNESFRLFMIPGDGPIGAPSAYVGRPNSNTGLSEGTGTPGRPLSLEFEADEAGWYLIHASGEGYTMRLERETGLDAHAIPISYGQRVEGDISDEHTSTVYTFDGMAGDVITITMSAISGDLDCYLALYDDSRLLIANDDAMPGTGVYDSAISAFVLPESGSYYIVATRYQLDAGETSGTYELIVEPG